MRTAIACMVLLPTVTSAAPRQPDAAELARAIERLGVVGNVLYVAAHPDDENTRLLAWLANERLVRAGYLSITRGDGGQNLIGAEQGPELGLIRTQELLAARAVDGAEQLFTRARDFGYSKSPDEALAIWGKDEILADVVLAIRRFKPDVIVTRFSPTATDTHGHHTASARLAVEAFRLAADPAYRPEQVARFGVWRAKRVVWNKSLWPGMKSTDDLSKFMKLDVGGYSPERGLSWGELAATSRTMHKSQGFGAAPMRGTALEYFQVLDGEPATSSPFEGVDASWSRVRGAEKLAELLRRARAEYRIERPHASIPILVEAAGALDKLPDSPWKADKRREIDQVIQWCAGLFVEATAAEFQTVPGGELAVTAVALDRSPAPVVLRAVELPGGAAVNVGKPLARDEPLAVEEKLRVPADAPLANPYWLDAPPERGLYPSPDAALTGLPERPPSLAARFRVEIGGRAIAVERPIVYKWTDPTAGERQRPVEVLPPIAIDPASPVLLFTDGKPRELRVTLRAAGPIAGTLKTVSPDGFSASPSEIPVKLEAGKQSEVIVKVSPPAGAKSAGGALRLQVLADDKSWDRGLARIDHPHIPIQTLLPPAEVKLVRFELARKHARVGYVPGAGDEVAPALRQAGYDVTLLDDAALERPLAPYEAIVLGVRALNVNPRLAAARDKLLAWVAAGGTLVVQYNTNNRLSKAPPSLGPKPFTITQERVTDENAAVELADHAVLKAPNEITAADFEGWIQERGLYFAGDADAAYDTPLAMHDPGEPPRKGSLLVTRHGKGAFVYTGLAFFRQLPAGVPGAFRLFANLIAYGR